MSAAGGLKWLHGAVLQNARYDAVLRDALPQIIAVVEATEKHYNEWDAVNDPKWLPQPIQQIGEALAALASRLSNAAADLGEEAEG